MNLFIWIAKLLEEHRVPEGEGGCGGRAHHHAALLRLRHLPEVRAGLPAGGHPGAHPPRAHAHPELRRLQAHDGLLQDEGPADDPGRAGAHFRK